MRRLKVRLALLIVYPVVVTIAIWCSIRTATDEFKQWHQHIAGVFKKAWNE